MADQEILYIVKADNKQAIDAFNKLKATMDGVTTKTKNLADKTQQSNMMLMSTGRIVQDAPFGLMGMGNNITFLAEQFANAKAQGTGFKDAIKGMGVAMLGTGGVIFAISTLVSIMTVMNRDTKTAESFTKDFIDTVIKGSNSSEEYAKSIGMVTKALREMTDENLKSRIAALTDEANSLFRSFTLLFNPSSFGQTLMGLQQVLTEKQQRDMKAGLNLPGQEGGLIQRLQKQIEINTELRDGAQTLSEQAKYQSVINQLQEQLNSQLGNTKKNLKDIEETMAKITGGRGSSFNRNKSAPGNPDLRLSLGGDATRNILSGGAMSAQFSKDYTDNIMMITQLTMSSADVLRGEFMSAWEDIFGEANSLFEKFMANIVNQLANMAITNLAGSFLNFLFPGAGVLAGMASGSLGKTQQINLQLDKQTMATWYVGGKSQASRLRMD